MTAASFKRIVENSGAIAVALMLLFVGCTVVRELGRGRDSTPAFSHAAHVANLGLKCENCHVAFKESDAAGMPALAVCEACHHEADAQYAKFLTRFVQSGSPVWHRVTHISEDVIFSHKRHYEAGIECDSCHHGAAKSEAVSLDLKPTKDDCLRCHAKVGLSTDCSVCHRTINKDFTPPSHSRSWRQLHGQIARSGRDTPCEYRCKMCHADSSCVACHQITPPAYHTNYFRRRGHGITAGMDRSRCQTCHRADFCTRCHEHTRPTSHSGSWGSPRNRHCLTCHFPLSDERCFVCHKTDSSHRTEATPMPDDQVHRTAGAEQCRACHTIDIPHPDAGEDCRRCHT
ncbi:MAG: cytochrome c3 family protein [Candidatus Coatesbacteria bacterium]|nr:cytochrome c3 family protein [Candidatus Coatesbacteria bacterium]